MTAKRRKFDWTQIHAELERRLSRLGATYENDEARVRALLAERSARLSLVPADQRNLAALTRLLVFRAKTGRYGLALARAHEIAPLTRGATLPGSSAAILGIINWRGEFVTVFDTARLLGRAAQDGASPRYAIVLRGGEPRIALAADSLEGVARLDLAKLQAPDQLSARARDLFRGMSEDAVLVFEDERLQPRLTEELRAA
jgi:chemotaxis signal transduction protein